MKKQSLLIPTISALALLTLAGVFFANNKNQRRSSKVVDETVEQTAKFLIKDRNSDPALKHIAPPQVIPVSSGSNIYGACVDKANADGISHWEIGGSAYCGYTHSIYLVPEELKVFKDAFGTSSIEVMIG